MSGGKNSFPNLSETTWIVPEKGFSKTKILDILMLTLEKESFELSDAPLGSAKESKSFGQIRSAFCVLHSLVFLARKKEA